MIFLSPGVKTREVDYSTYTGQLSSCIVGMVGAATKGPVMTPTLCTSPANFADTFGVPTPEDYGAYAALEFLKRGNQLYYIRVANGTEKPASAKLFTGMLNVESKYPGTSYENLAVEVIDKKYYETLEEGEEKLYVMNVYQDNALEESIAFSLDPESPNYIKTKQNASYFVNLDFNSITFDFPSIENPAFDETNMYAFRNADEPNTNALEIVQTFNIEKGRFKTLDPKEVSCSYHGSYVYVENAQDYANGVCDYVVTIPATALASQEDPNKRVINLFFNADIDADSPDIHINKDIIQSVKLDSNVKNRMIVTLEENPNAQAYKDWLGEDLAVPLKNGYTSKVSIFGSTMFRVNMSGGCTLEMAYSDQGGDPFTDDFKTDKISKSMLLFREPGRPNIIKVIPDADMLSEGTNTVLVVDNGTNVITMNPIVPENMTETGNALYFEFEGRGAEYFDVTVMLEGIQDEDAPIPALARPDTGYMDNFAIKREFTFALSQPVQTAEIDSIPDDMYTTADKQELKCELVIDSPAGTDKPESGQTIKVTIPDKSPYSVKPGTAYTCEVTLRLLSALGAESFEKVRFTILPDADAIKAFTIDNAGSFPTAKGMDPSQPGSEPLTPLTGAANGILPSIPPADVNKGIRLLLDAESMDVGIICAPGQSHRSSVQTLLDTAATRTDCIAFIDPPQGLSPTEVIAWHNGKLGDISDPNNPYPTVPLNTSFGALFYPWVMISDLYSGNEVWIPPSGSVAGAYAYNDEVENPWFAAAGIERGSLTGVIAVERSLDEGQRDAIYGNTNAVNAIVNYKGQGIVIWGQKTLQRKQSALDRINVRRLVNIVRKAIAASTLYLLFDLNDELTWRRWEGMVNPYLENIMNSRGLYNYKVQMDSETVTAYHQDRNEMPGKIWLQPTKTAEYISIDFILTNTGAAFTS